MKPANSLMSGLGTTVFEVMSGLARQHQSVNLGQGFPDDKGPEEVRRAAAEYLLDGHNQYPPMMGIPELRQAVAEHARRFQGLDVDWQTEVLVTSGATEALGDCLFGLIEPGDEVVLIEPLYDSYLPIVRRAGGIPKLVRLEPPHWSLPRQELTDAFGSKTKLILFNTPMNPCSKVFDRSELDFIASLCLKHDAYAVCDEVYEHIIFDDRRHVSIMTLPGMRERSARIGSAGKSFSLTGWKVGYVTAPAEMMRVIAKTHQFMTFTTPPNLQWGTATGCAWATAISIPWRAKWRASATGWNGTGRDWLRGVARARHVLRDDRFPAAGLQRHRRGFLPPHHRRGRGDRRAGQRVLRRSGAGTASLCAILLLQARSDAGFSAVERLGRHFKR